jgi:hypothetical protein
MRRTETPTTSTTLETYEAAAVHGISGGAPSISFRQAKSGRGRTRPPDAAHSKKRRHKSKTPQPEKKRHVRQCVHAVVYVVRISVSGVSCAAASQSCRREAQDGSPAVPCKDDCARASRTSGRHESGSSVLCVPEESSLSPQQPSA